MRRPQESLSFSAQQVRDLAKLVSQGEGSQLEFKRKAAYPDKIVREMIAFANSRGGTLLVGVGDDGSLAGLKDPEGEAHVIRESLKKCSPPLRVTEEFIPIGNSRTVLSYLIPESLTKPHYQQFENDRHCFVRVNDQSIRASREMREIIRRERSRKDVKFHYGEHEDFLMKYLADHSTITLKEFIALRGVKKIYASRKFVLLVLADVLTIKPHEKGDIYSLAFR